MTSMGRKRPRKTPNDADSKKLKHHLVEYGESHPIDDAVDFENSKKTVVSNKSSFVQEEETDDDDEDDGDDDDFRDGFNEVNDDEEKDEEANPLSQLISMFGNKSHKDYLKNTGDESDLNSEDHSDEEAEEEYDQVQDEQSEDEEIDLEDEKEVNLEDMFHKHFETVVSEEIIQEIQDGSANVNPTKLNWQQLGQMTRFSKLEESVKVIRELDDIHVKKSLIDNIKIHRLLEMDGAELNLPKYHREMLSLLGRYNDVYYPNRTLENGEDLRFMYTLHAINHVLKTRSKIVHHNAKLAKNRNSDLEYRDHGLTRPKVLMVVPFKESALRIVKIIESLLMSDEKANILNKKRFKDDFSIDKEAEERFKKKKISRPDDFNMLFAGNIDDAFRVGLSITKKSVRLYADFYSSDIIIASPLGLRTIIGAEGEKDRDFDFLSSIEMLICDQAEVFTMQNWDHVLHLMDHMHQQPKEAHGLDFSRVRMWCLNGWSKFYRQTLIFSSVLLPVINSLFNNLCHNYAGKIKVSKPVLEGTINRVAVQLPHMFHRFEAKSAMDVIDERFNYFISKILPQFKEPVMSHTLIFIPSYFDFIRLRNYMKREDMSITQICEYTKDAKISRARNLFFHNKRHFLLYTERFHFYRRYQVKGIRHILFYELPSSPHFYSELCNFLHTNNTDSAEVSCSVLYSKFDTNMLIEVVGTERATIMLNSEKKSHMFVTGD